jgi:hypothetical protein
MALYKFTERQVGFKFNQPTKAFAAHGAMQDEERVRQRAHKIWEEAGRPDGQHDAHWEQACREIEAEDGEPPAG